MNKCKPKIPNLERNTKAKTIICSAVTAGLLALWLVTPAVAKHKQSKLEAQAKVSRADAGKIAFTKAPNGVIKEGELEKEHDQLIWSFDIATPNSKDITEVAVDANTGAVISVDAETPEQQVKEAAEDAAKEKNQQGRERRKRLVGQFF